MALPKQVERDLKELEEYEKAQKPLADPDQQEANTLADEAADPAPQEAPKAEDTPTTEAAPSQSDELARWEQRYNSLQGKYNAEVPHLHAQNKQLQEQIDALKAQFDKAQEAKPAEAKKLVTDEDVSSFGEDLIDVQRRVARDVFTEYVTPLQQEVELLKQEKQKLLEQVQGTSNQVAMTQFEARLRQAVPDFDQINADPRWVAWLDEMDPILRAPRRSVAQAAFDASDADAVAHYVSLFKQGQGQQPKANRHELERQVAPTRSNAASSVSAPEGRVYTEAEASRQFNKVSELNRRGKYDEANKLEAELTNAYMHGRVRG